MSELEKIEVNIHRIPAEGLALKGTLGVENFKVRKQDTFCVKAPVDYDLQVQLLQSQLLINGQANMEISCSCDRCLKDFSFLIKKTDVCHYIEELGGDEIDISDFIREDLLLEVPMKRVCMEDCKGICQSCGKNLNEERCSCEPDKPAPSVWDQLDGLDL